MLSEGASTKIQRLIDEYLGAIGSAAIVSRRKVLFQSTQDNAACRLVPTFDQVPLASMVEDGPTVVNLAVSSPWCSYGVSLDSHHVLFVITENAVAPAWSRLA